MRRSGQVTVHRLLRIISSATYCDAFRQARDLSISTDADTESGNHIIFHSHPVHVDDGTGITGTLYKGPSESLNHGLLVQLHGFKMDIETHEKNVQMRELAFRKNFYVLAIEAPHDFFDDRTGEYKPAWGIPDTPNREVCELRTANNAEGIIARMDKVIHENAIDPSHIHLEGFSQGAYMAFHVLARAPRTICSISATSHVATGFLTMKRNWWVANVELQPRPILLTFNPDDPFNIEKPEDVHGHQFEVMKRIILQVPPGKEVPQSVLLVDPRVDAKGSYYMPGDRKDQNETSTETLKLEVRDYDIDGKLRLREAVHNGRNAKFADWKGHCWPTNKPDPNLILHCKQASEYAWNEKVFEFFEQTPCIDK